MGPSRTRRKKNQAMKENVRMMLQEWTQRTLHQKNKLKVYCKADLLLGCATVLYVLFAGEKARMP